MKYVSVEIRIGNTNVTAEEFCPITNKTGVFSPSILLFAFPTFPSIVNK